MPTTAAATAATDLPTYVVVTTIDPDGKIITDEPVDDRIVATFPPVPGHAMYGEALELAHEIRRGAGWALVIDTADLDLYRR